MIKKDWLLEASVDGSFVDYEQTYTVESETVIHHTKIWQRRRQLPRTMAAKNIC